MAAKNSTPQPHAAPVESAEERRGRGRPPVGEEPMTAAERASRYRQSKKARALDAVVAPAEHTRVTLMTSLNRCLERLDNYTGRSAVVRENMRHGARLLIDEIVTRYGI